MRSVNFDAICQNVHDVTLTKVEKTWLNIKYRKKLPQETEIYEPTLSLTAANTKSGMSQFTPLHIITFYTTSHFKNIFLFGAQAMKQTTHLRRLERVLYLHSSYTPSWRDA